MLLNVQELFAQAKKTIAQNSAPPANGNTPSGATQNTATQNIATPIQDTSIYSNTTLNGFENTNTLSDEEVDARYKEWIAEKQAMGLRTTHMRNDNEVNFAEYAAALSEELKAELASYFEDGAINRDEAIKAQQEIAGLYKNDNSLYYADFIKAVRALGYDISTESVNTSYITDDKKSAAKGGGTFNEHGRVTVYTIKNKEGEVLFKVADSNGNAEVELEEVFLNELITGVSNQIDVENLAASAGVYVGGGTVDATYTSFLDAEGNSIVGNVDEAVDDSEVRDGKYVINQAQYNTLLNEKARLLEDGGLSPEDAESEAKKFMNSNYVVDNSSTNTAIRVSGFSNTDNRIRVDQEAWNTIEKAAREEVEEMLSDEEFINAVLKNADYDKYGGAYKDSNIANHFLIHKDEYLKGEITIEEIVEAVLKENFVIEDEKELEEQEKEAA